MTVTFEGTLDDLVVYNNYGYINTPQLGRRYRVYRYAAPFAVFALIMALNLILQDGAPSLTTLLFALAVATVHFFCVPMIYRRAIRRQTQYAAQLGSYQGAIGKRAITLAPDGITSITSIGETRYRWEAVTNIVKTEAQILIFLSEVMAIVIPRRAFADAAHEAAFLAEAERYRASTVTLPVGALATTTPTAQTSNAPWWSGQTVASVDADAQVNVNRRNG